MLIFVSTYLLYLFKPVQKVSTGIFQGPKSQTQTDYSLLYLPLNMNPSRGVALGKGTNEHGTTGDW